MDLSRQIFGQGVVFPPLVRRTTGMLNSVIKARVLESGPGLFTSAAVTGNVSERRLMREKLLL